MTRGRSDNPFRVIGDTRPCRVVEKSRYRRAKTRGGRVGGFPESERAIQGAPEKRVAQKILDAREVLVARLRGNSYWGRAYRGVRDCLRGEN